MEKQFERIGLGLVRLLALSAIMILFTGCSTDNEVYSEKSESESIEDLTSRAYFPYGENTPFGENTPSGENPSSRKDSDAEMADEQLQYADEDSSAMLGLRQYINDNLKLMGTFWSPAFEFDVTGDGYPDLCTNLTRGSGIISTDIVVYDPVCQKGYVLSDRGEFDYYIQGVENGEIKVLKRQNYPLSLDDELDEFQGVLGFEDDALIFLEKNWKEEGGE